MATNFQILIQKSNKIIHLELLGDFDGTSACKLLNIIEDYEPHVHKIIINTDGLDEIHPFGKGVFEKNFHGMIKKSNIKFIFTGENAIIDQ